MSGTVRMLLFFYNFILLLFAGLLIATALGEVNIKPYLEMAMATSQNRIMVGVGGVILCLLSMIGIVKAIFGNSEKIASIAITDTGVPHYKSTSR